MATVTDPDGVQWKVYRLWSPDWDYSDLQEAFFFIVWPLWFLAKCLGLRWIIQVERDGRWVGDAKVRGWRKSQRRIQELAESVAAGTLQQ